MRPLERLVKQTIKRVEAFGGDDLNFRGSHIVGVIAKLDKDDALRFEEGRIPESVVRIEVRASEISGKRPETGECLTQSNRDTYEIVSVDYIGGQKKTYYLYCSWFPNE
jgi:hypothetical protein